MEVFVAFDPADAERAAELIAAWSTTSEGAVFTSWAPEAVPEHPYINPPGTGPRFYDSAGRPVVTDDNKIKRAVGVLILVTGRAADSEVVRAAVETAYGLGTQVAAVQVDPHASLPQRVLGRKVITADSHEVAHLLARWQTAAHDEQSLSWWGRVRHALRADRDARR